MSLSLLSVFKRNAMIGAMPEAQPIGESVRQQKAVAAITTSNYFVNTTWLSAFVLIAITILVYQPVWHAGFIWDDDISITDNHLVKAKDGLRRLWLTTEATDYWPLTSSAWWLEWRLWGIRPRGYHMVNVTLHAANAVLVWVILRHLKIPGGWLAGLAWAIHPVNAATVAWVSEQKNTLSMLFYLVTILMYLRFNERQRWRWYGAALMAFLLALFSKSAVVMLPVVLLGCVWWLRGQSGRRHLLCSIPFFALSLVFGLVTIWFQFHHSLEGHSIRTAGLLARLTTAGWAVGFYLWKALWPLGLSAVYPAPSFDRLQASSLVPATAVAGLLIFSFRRFTIVRRPILFGIGYFVVTLFPVLGFFDQTFYRYSLVADHWQYFAIGSPIALVVGGGVCICHRLGEWSKCIGGLASAVLLVMLGVATWTRSSVYASSETLWRDTLAKNPNSWVAHYNLANALLHAGRIQDAVGQYELALEIKPDYREANNNLAFILLQAGKINDAIKHLEQAVRVGPNVAEGQHNLGFALLLAGRSEDAINHLEQAVRLKPDYAEAHYSLGNALLTVGKRKEAITQYELAVQLKPDFTDARNALDRLRGAQ